MTYELKTKVNLSPASQKILDNFIRENNEIKEVTYHDVFNLIARASGLMAVMTLENGKKLDQYTQKQLLELIYDKLVGSETNGFEKDAQLQKIIDTIYSVRNGQFEINLGKKGAGIFPCCGTVKVILD